MIETMLIVGLILSLVALVIVYSTVDIVKRTDAIWSEYEKKVTTPDCITLLSPHDPGDEHEVRQ